MLDITSNLRSLHNVTGHVRSYDSYLLHQMSHYLINNIRRVTPLTMSYNNVIIYVMSLIMSHDKSHQIRVRSWHVSHHTSHHVIRQVICNIIIYCKPCRAMSYVVFHGMVMNPLYMHISLQFTKFWNLFWRCKLSYEAACRFPFYSYWKWYLVILTKSYLLKHLPWMKLLFLLYFQLKVLLIF